MPEFLPNARPAPPWGPPAVDGDAGPPRLAGEVAAVLHALGDPETGYVRIARALEAAPRLAARLPELAESAGFTPRARVASLEHTVCLLGRAGLEATVVALGVADALPRAGAPGFEPSRFWRAAARRAATARALADLIDPAARAESFTAALLQDMALPVLARQVGDPYARLLETWRGGDGDLARMERQAFGWDHAEAGAWLCEHWGLPGHLAAAIAVHHERDGRAPSPIPASQLVGVLRDGDGDEGVPQLIEAAWADHEIPAEETALAVAAGFEAAGDIAGCFC